VGSYRIKTIEKNANNFTGEVTTLTCTKTKTDITDRLADIYKKLQRMLNSSTVMDKMFAEGSKQKKINADVVEDIWQQTASNKYATELPEDATDDYLDECGTLTYTCNKDEFLIQCTGVNSGRFFLWEPLLKFSRDPRFTCDIEVDTTDNDPWNTDDYVYLRIWQVNPASLCDEKTIGFGFEIIYDGATYNLYARLNDGVDSSQIKISALTLNIKYTLEARMEWKEKVVKYYFGRPDIEEGDSNYNQWGFKLRAILPISVDAVDEEDLLPFEGRINSTQAANVVGVFVYRWKTQAIRAVKKEE